MEGKYGWSLPPCFPKLVSLLGCSWLPLPTLGSCLPPCLPSLSPFMIFLLGCSWLPLPSLSPFMISSGLLLAAAAVLSPKLVSLHDFPPGLLLVAAPANMISPGGCSWLPLPPWFPSLSPFLDSFLGCSSSCSGCILFLFLWCCWFAVICCLLLVPVLVFLVLWLWMYFL